MKQDNTQELLNGITVLICTYNGALRIGTTLRHLARQRVGASLSWEILLINNASTDDTAQVAGEVWRKTRSAVPFVILDEARPGKNNAIDKGLATATYKYVLICDDDNWLDENYVQTAWQIMVENPSIGMLGGRSSGVFEEEPPPWFEAYQGYYAVGRQHSTSGELPTNRFLWGAGTVINREAYALLLNAGFKRIITYEQHPRIARGEDVELCFALRLTGYKIWYDDRLHLRHFMTRDRLKWSYFLELTKVAGLLAAVLNVYRLVTNHTSPKTLFGQVWLRMVLQRVLYTNVVSAAFLPPSTKAGDASYQLSLLEYYTLKGYLSLKAKFDLYRRNILVLQEQLSFLKKQYQTSNSLENNRQPN